MYASAQSDCSTLQLRIGVLELDVGWLN